MNSYLCLDCGEPTTVIETRISSSRLRRRRKCVEGHRFTTLEIPHTTSQKLIELIQWISRHRSDPDVLIYADRQVRLIMTGTDSPE